MGWDLPVSLGAPRPRVTLEPGAGQERGSVASPGSQGKGLLAELHLRAPALVGCAGALLG